MIHQWETTVSKDIDKLRRRVYKGIPDALRGKIWSKLLRLDTIKEEQRGKYQVRGIGKFSVGNNTANRIPT